MGNRISASLNNTWRSLGAQGRGKKRKNDDDGSRGTPPPSPSQTSEILRTPKRKRIQSTSKYIYKTLFLDGENSDVSIIALDKVWPLHKVYLSQSPYFSCMFNGPWMESSQSQIEIDIQDPNIDETALRVAFGSLYKDYVFIKPVGCVGVLAAATLLQLEGLIEQCVSLMTDTISSETVCCYYRAGFRYGLDTLKHDCFNWLLINILSTQDTDLLKEISMDLMIKLIESSKLYVMQVETDIYTLVKKWTYLQLHQNWCGGPKDLVSDVDQYFKEKLSELKDSQTFLDTEEGQPYIEVFFCIRWQYIITDMPSLRVIENDRIFSIDWIKPVFESQWRNMLQLEQGLDKGPEEVPDDDVFDKLCMRCGRVLPKEGEFHWRWIGYNFGIDLLMSYSNRLITIKRNTNLCPYSVNQQSNRHVVFRLTVSSSDENFKQKHIKSTGIIHVCLGKNEEYAVMTLDSKFSFPLSISLSLLLTTPPPTGTDLHQSILQTARKHITRTECGVQTDFLYTKENSVQTDWGKVEDILPVTDLLLDSVSEELSNSGDLTQTVADIPS